MGMRFIAKIFFHKHRDIFSITDYNSNRKGAIDIFFSFRKVCFQKSSSDNLIIIQFELNE